MTAIGRHRRAAFTLLEILVVIAILAVLMALSLPNLWSTFAAEQLPESAARLKSLIAMCRAQAMNDARNYRVRFLPDGTLKVERQVDAVYAPHVYLPVTDQWARQPILLEDVWVSEILSLPEGPPPIDIEDDLVEFDEMIEEPVPVRELDEPLVITFLPDGLSGSAEWTLRDRFGRGLIVTLDGRLGSVKIKPAEGVSPDELERPPAFEEDLPYEGMSEQEVLEEFMPT